MSMQPTFDPSKWHACNDAEIATCERNTNCYSYALNRPDYYWAVPGMGFAKTNTKHFLENATKVFEAFPTDEAFRKAMADGAEQDGLLPATGLEARAGYYLAALLVSEKAGDRDFHWYRQDDDGTWSHKDGRTAPSNKDDNGAAIYDPRLAKHEAYPVFCGFFLVPHQGIGLQQSFPLV